MVAITVSVLVPLLLYFLNKASKKNVAASGEGSYELRMNNLYLLMGIMSAFLGLLFLLMPVLSNEYSLEIFIASGVMFLVFIGFAVPCILWYKNHRLFFNEQGFILKGAYGKKLQIKWEDISQVSFSSFTGVITVVDRQGNIAKAHQHLVGFSSFVKMLLVQKDKYRFASELLPLKTLGLDK
jgi:hypothetical protein